jgi:hypothetical protein
MKKLCEMFVPVMLLVLILSGALAAQDRGRDGAIRGTFVRLIEREADQGQVMGIVVKPSERDEPVTVLVPRENEDLRQAARRLQEGQIVEIAFTSEGENNWLRRLEVSQPRDRGEQRPEGRREPTIERQARRQQRQSEDMPEPDRARTFRNDEQRERFAARRERQPQRPMPRLDQMEEQLRDVIAGHTERMSRAIREVLRSHLEPMQAEIRELHANMERMERQMQELRAENERLRMQLRDRGEPGPEREPQIREQTEPQRRRENRQAEEREPQRDRDQRREPAPSPQ